MHMRTSPPPLSTILSKIHNVSSLLPSSTCIPPTSNSIPPTSKPHILIDFSSPNIAKPFHAGHLRSTIIGNTVANILEINNKVTRINYLGDWGMQFAMLAVGEAHNNIETSNGTGQCGSEEIPKEHTVHDTSTNQAPEEITNEFHHTDTKQKIYEMYRTYVKVHEEAKKNKTIKAQAHAWFGLLEGGDKDALRYWNSVRSTSIEHYKAQYSRLGVRFDEYAGESLTSTYIPSLLKELEDKDMIDKDADTGALLTNEPGLPKTVLQKADGTSLYLLRDLAEIKRRLEKYENVNKIIYVTGTDQEFHFKTLFSIADRLGLMNKDKLVHIRFGNIRGMSTRKGTAVFLDDILDEAQQHVYNLMKPGEQDLAVADTVGISGLVIRDLKSRRHKDYTWDWEVVTKSQGDTGIMIQYTHARLCSIVEKAGIVPVVPTLEYNETFTPLATLLHRYDDVLSKVQVHLDPVELVTYLLALCREVSRILQRERVLGEPHDLMIRNLWMYSACQKRIAHALSILGLKGLKRM